MKKIKQFFCSHNYVKIEDNEINNIESITKVDINGLIVSNRSIETCLHRCEKCGKETMMSSGWYSW